MPSSRMHRGLVALSASAVAAIYMAGYLRTQSADASIGASAQQSPSVTASATNPALSATPTVIAQLPPIVQRQVPVASPTQPTTPLAQRTAPQPTAPPALTAPQPAAGAFKDGTFTGQGSSRRGDVWVSVQVQSGHIANVTITRSTLQYPLRDIAGLPSQVVQRQSAQVDIVSRATYSSQAFKQAVSQALSKAA
jgi:uncharacterized protein with FMN-binding domain